MQTTGRSRQNRTHKRGWEKEETERNAMAKEPLTADKMLQLQKEVKDIPEEKPVKLAIQNIYEGKFLIVLGQ